MYFKDQDGEDIFAVKFNGSNKKEVFHAISMEGNCSLSDIAFTYNPQDSLYKFFSTSNDKKCTPKFIKKDEWLVFSDKSILNVISEYEFNLRYNGHEDIKKITPHGDFGAMRGGSCLTPTKG